MSGITLSNQPSTELIYNLTAERFGRLELHLMRINGFNLHIDDPIYLGERDMPLDNVRLVCRNHLSKYRKHSIEIKAPLIITFYGTKDDLFRYYGCFCPCGRFISAVIWQAHERMR
jgi:hypothetical protein